MDQEQQNTNNKQGNTFSTTPQEPVRPVRPQPVDIIEAEVPATDFRTKCSNDVKK